MSCVTAFGVEPAAVPAKVRLQESFASPEACGAAFGLVRRRKPRLRVQLRERPWRSATSLESRKSPRSFLRVSGLFSGLIRGLKLLSMR